MGLACQSRRPSVLVADPGCLSLELRMSEDELGADINWLEIDLNAREIASLIQYHRGPLPAHHQALGLHDLENMAMPE